jgi:N-acetylated-alpha-linked acidic dipeptidase
MVNKLLPYYRVTGAIQSGAGTAALLEIARSFGIMLNAGWKPKRTIILASWDAKEYGMIGSTEFVEHYESVFGNTTVAYLNVDTVVSGSNFWVEATPSLSRIIRNVSQSVSHPELEGSVYDNWLNNSKLLNVRRKIPLVQKLGITADYTPFVHRWGCPSADISFRNGLDGNRRFGTFRTSFDSYNYYTKFIDPTFKYIVGVTKLWGMIALQLIESRILPFDYSEYVDDLLYYTEKLEKKMADNDMRLVRLSSLRGSICNLENSVRRIRLEIKSLNFDNPSVETNSHIRSINDRLMRAERQFLKNKENWFEHVLLAPGDREENQSLVFQDLVNAIETKNIEIIKDVENQIATIVNNVANCM